uniref:Ciliary microtubule associated protein 1B n=1 Tax=Xiphophorus couchianus TaxID=32473 RepID=A0A3B5MSD2_9TELE
MPSDELWVGPWKPHRPRGPIAALYGSPGPKYSLPGLIGASQHDPTKCKAPMFSFGARHEEANTNCSPGPRYLIPSNMTMKAPNYTLQGRGKTGSFHEDYNKVTFTRAKAPSFTFGLRHSQYIAPLIINVDE